MTTFQHHLESGATTLCRAWRITRTDGVALGFTDHDGPLEFDGLVYLAENGLSAGALQSATGLSVDNSEAEGVLNGPDLSADVISAGLLDGAEVVCFEVNWQDPNMRRILFRGEIGDLTLSGQKFTAELRGMSERLNVPMGRLYHKECAAILGDRQCGVDLSQPIYLADCTVLNLQSGGAVSLDGLGGFAAGWFAHGTLEVTEGAAQGMCSVIKVDQGLGSDRLLSLWDALALAEGDKVRLRAGCDRRAQSCRSKFDNFLNFRGFPDIPGDDWLMQTPMRSHTRDGGSRR